MPMFEFSFSRSSSFVIRGGVFAAVVGALTLGAHAQHVAQPTTGPVAATTAPLFADLTTRPMDLASLAGVTYSSSSDSLLPSDSAAADAGTLNFPATSLTMQPPPRRRYGRPRYNDSSHNSDGSNKYVFEAAAGLTLPLGDTYRYFNTGYAFQVGGGRQFNKNFAVLLQFDYDNFGINKNTLDTQAAIYNGTIGVAGSGCGPGQGESGCALPVDGNNHVWSFTLDPTYTFLSGDKYGAYAVVGAGYYHKVTSFTTPETGYYDTYFGLVPVTENAVFDHYSANAFGGNLGLGLTYKFSRFADERFFVEARYVIVDNAQRTGLTYENALTTYYNPTTGPGGNYTGNNFFPANSNKTTYVPIKIGIRF